MCIGNTCGGMTTTTIYSAASGEPVTLIAGAVAVAACIVLAALLVRYDLISLKGTACSAITS